MAIPKPGKPVRGSLSGAPIMALFDLLGRRWAMGIVWSLSSGPATFRALQSYCERKSGTISPSILNSRIKDLQQAKLVERTLDGYQLTALGHELFEKLEPLGEWSRKWGKEIEE
ncbi:MAG: helix-turn-helix domain-containing protein [Oscillospiraceae bacterium]|jgi:DNA-binding HxlR family transcriptional regulator|nr:helix-turn-helix domain-containing protein [Oscillospiraceae bacterium]